MSNPLRPDGWTREDEANMHELEATAALADVIAAWPGWREQVPGWDRFPTPGRLPALLLAEHLRKSSYGQ